MFRRMTRERYLSDQELSRFMSAVRERRHVHQPRDYAMFALLANTGLRPSEVRALTRADCHLEGREPWIRVFRLKKKKTLPEFDDLPIPIEVARALEPVLPVSGSDRVFVVHPRRMQRLFHAYCRAARVRRTRLYSLRHTAATRLYCATRNISTVQAVLGHETPTMTTIYAHVPDSLLKKLATELPAAL